jgi:hypothetical protein
MLNINDYIEMTKEDFIKLADERELCPSNFGLNEIVNCGHGEKVDTCHNCWECAIKDIDFFNPMMAFQNNAITVLDALRIVEEQYQQLDEGRKDLKNKLMVLMEQYGIDKFENEKLSITYVKGVTGTTFDSTKFKKEHAGLHAAYQKPSLRAASIRFKVK